MTFLVDRALTEAQNAGRPLTTQVLAVIEEVVRHGDAASQAKTTRMLREHTGAKSASRSAIISGGV
eukprot:5495678-Prymnesium_polylepis.1